MSKTGVRRQSIGTSIAIALVFCTCIPARSQMSQRTVDLPASGQQEATLKRVPDVGRFIQIPGPNPILVTGGAKEWDGGEIEAGNVLKDGEVYYFYYHGTPRDKEKWPRQGYRIGVATAPSPLGPWKKYEGNPIIDLGSAEGWDGGSVACPTVVKEEATRYFLWYCGIGKTDDHHWSIGLATASNPLGPWKKFEGNPVVKDFGYVGGVVEVNGQFRMYSAWPVGATSPDQGPIYVATASKPAGPWTKHTQKPVLPAGDWDAWDDGGFSEAGVLFHDGLFHIFYGGTKWKKLESTGYAYSYDGFNFIKYPGNPVAPRENNPDASAFAEDHALWESPFYYIFHTLRYISRGGEDIGVQVLATRTPFSLAMPVLNLATLSSGKATELKDSPPISVGDISRLAFTVECKYSENAKQAIKVHVRLSSDGVNYDTADVLSFQNALAPGQEARTTIAIEPKFRFVKVIVENADPSESVSGVKLIATLGD